MPTVRQRKPEQVPTSPSSLQRAGLLVRVSVLLGALCCAAGMRLYPGGTQFDASQIGYDFWLNFICDGVQPIALNGQPNPLGSVLLMLGMCSLGLGVLPICWHAGALLAERPRASAVIRYAGTLGSLLMLVVYLSAGREPFHSLLFIAGPLCVVALTTLVAELALDFREHLELLCVTASLVLVSMVELVLFVHWKADHTTLTPILPAFQKGVLLIGIGWMLVAARELGRRGQRIFPGAVSPAGPRA